ncbi:DNA-directed RNA polymerase subunit H [Candidatus Woesearchaeota archaeon]|nr:DNA-directed RNA polymerase subunit H [Candidatus Woesearchaeota archaeon]
MGKFDISTHQLVPDHKILSDKEKKEFFDRYQITPKEVPKILITDPAIVAFEPKEGDIVRVKRKSPTAGDTVFYRVIING